MRKEKKERERENEDKYGSLLDWYIIDNLLIIEY